MMLRTAVLMALLAGTPLSAQELDVNRRAFTFVGNRLVVSVSGDVPGELHVIRGEAGRVEAAARTDGGFSGFGLTSSRTPTLQLSAVGADRVRYLVVVPERVQVAVRLPGRHDILSAGTSPEPSTFRWSEQAAGGGLPEILPTTREGLFTIRTDRWAPSSVDVPSLDAVRSIAVRFEGATFRLLASRPLTVSGGSPDHLRIDVGGDPVDLVLYVPEGRNAFTVTGGGVRLVETLAGRPYTKCAGVVVQRPSAYQQWFTFVSSPGQRPCELARIRSYTP